MSSSSMTKSSPEAVRYTRVAIFLHWAIAFFIIFNLVLGHVMSPYHGPERYYFLTFHQSAGITVLLLTIARIVWRLMNPPPPHPEDMPAVERHAAAFVHFLLYAAMLFMSVGGWLMVSANPAEGTAGHAEMLDSLSSRTAGGLDMHGPKPRPIKVWFAVPLKPIAVIEQLGSTREGWHSQDVLHEVLVDWHKLGGWLTIALLLLHVLGALKHQYIDKQKSMQRMGVGT